jgi:L,D-transpeptidase YcbB
LILVLADVACFAGASAAPVALQPPSAVLQSFEINVEIRAQSGGRIKKFYAGRNFSPIWVSSGSIGPDADALLNLLATADLDGLKPSSYKIEKLRKLVDLARSGDVASVARAELKLADALSRYMNDMRRPSKQMKSYLSGELKPKKLKADALLASAMLAQPLGAYISSMGWMNPRYVLFRKLLARAKSDGRSAIDVQRLRLNLERARVLPGPWTHHIIVDAAAGELWYYQAGKEKGRMRVIVGKPATPTPMLAGMLYYAILNPYWNVPTDLAKSLIAPKILAGRTLRSMDIEALSDWSANPGKLESSAINWPLVASGAQEIRLRQLPGASNSMGRVKFMFPNEQGIYLHDTPERELLNKADRHLSNGCIRLENATKLGDWLLGMSTRKLSKLPEQIIALPLPVPVYLTYFSAIESKEGAAFLPDVYNRDQ